MDEELYLFMDTNVYLRFYSFSKDELQTLSQVYEALKNKHFIIVTNTLLKDEFERRREECLKETFDYKEKFEFKKTNYPILFSDEDEDYQKLIENEKQLRKSAREYSSQINQIIKKLKNNYSKKSLFSDQLIERIFQKSKTLEVKKELIDNATHRMQFNNPPGKKNQLGDRIHWEALLEGINGNLIIISDDSDFYSVLNSTKINPFLENEWRKCKNSSIEIYKTLSEFMRFYTPDFELPNELALEIKEKIFALRNSDSFSETHQLIAEITPFYKYFTKSHIRSIIDCCIKNAQIYHITEDNDLKKFLHDLKRHENYDKSFDKDYNDILESKI